MPPENSRLRSKRRTRGCPNYFLAGFFLLPLLFTDSGPCHSRSAGMT